MAPLPGMPCAHTTKDDFCPGKLPVFTVKMGGTLLSNAAVSRGHSWGVAIPALEIGPSEARKYITVFEGRKKTKPKQTENHHRLKYLVKNSLWFP